MVTTFAHMDTTDVIRQVADTVRAKAADAGMTQIHLSEVTNIPRTTLMRRMSATTPFTIAELAAISAALDCDLASLVTPQRIEVAA